MAAKEEGAGGEMDWEPGVERGKLLHLGWRNKVLLYSTWNYIQYPLTNHNGKEHEKKNITEPLCSIEETNTTL